MMALWQQLVARHAVITPLHSRHVWWNRAALPPDSHSYRWNRTIVVCLGAEPASVRRFSCADSRSHLQPPAEPPLNVVLQRIGLKHTVILDRVPGVDPIAVDAGPDDR